MFSPKVVVATFGAIERVEVINSTRELREKLSHVRGTNSRLPTFGATVNLNFSNELFNPPEIILVKLVPVCHYCVLHNELFDYYFL